jgi:hypothetical protein
MPSEASCRARRAPDPVGSRGDGRQGPRHAAIFRALCAAPVRRSVALRRMPRSIVRCYLPTCYLTPKTQDPIPTL